MFQQLAEGDHTAFTELFYHYSARLFPFLLKKVQQAAIAEELLQDIFLKLWTHREDFHAIENPESYLFRMAANKALDHFTKMAYEERVRLQASAQQPQEESGRTIEFREVERFAQEAIQQLPSQRKTIYQLREQGLSYIEIAEQLQISPNTVRNQLVDASKFIRDFLLKKGITPVLLVQWLLTTLLARV